MNKRVDGRLLRALLIVAGAVTAMTIGAGAAEPTYEQWAAMGGKMYSAFRCSALAAEAGRRPCACTAGRGAWAPTANSYL